jgi:hypothetical protein
MIGVNPATAFNRDWQREGILTAGFEKLFELDTTALILDEALSTRMLNASDVPTGSSPRDVSSKWSRRHRREMETTQEPT